MWETIGVLWFVLSNSIHFSTRAIFNTRCYESFWGNKIVNDSLFTPVVYNSTQKNENTLLHGWRTRRFFFFLFFTLFFCFFLEIDFQDLHWSKTKKGECRMRECVRKRLCVCVRVKNAGDCLNKVCVLSARERDTHVYVWSCDRLLRIITFTCSFNRTVWLCSSLRKSEVTSYQNQHGYWRGWQNKCHVNSLELHVSVRLLFSVFSCADSSCVSLGGVRCLYYRYGWLQLSGMGFFVSVLLFHLPLQFLWT